MSTYGPGVETVTPPEMRHDPAALAAAGVTAGEARRAWEAAARERDIGEGNARRSHGTYDRGELRAVTEREQNAREWMEHCERIHEERQVVAILAVAVAELGELHQAVVDGGTSAAASLAEVVDRIHAFNRARGEVDVQLRQIGGDAISVRLSLSGSEDRYARLPARIDDPVAALDRVTGDARRAARQGG